MSTHENAEETHRSLEELSETVIGEDVRKAIAAQESKTLAQAQAVPDIAKIEHPEGRLLAVDGHSLAFRAFFALPEENFTTSDGQCTNSVYGFITMLAYVVKKERPTHIGVAFDVKGGTFRNAMLPGYKGTRSTAPPELLSQIPLIQQLLSALNIPCIERPGYEGDDVIASLATYGERNGYITLVLSGDRDSFQLVDDNVTVLYPGRHFSDLKRMTPQAVLEKYKVTPHHYPDIAALRGEQSDNIPGVPGVGDGFAAKWVNQYGGLDGIIAHAAAIGGKKGQALRDHLDQVVLNRRVNAVVRDLDCGVDFNDLKITAFDQRALDAVLRRLQFGARTRTNLMRTFSANSGQEIDAAKLSNFGATSAPSTPGPQTETPGATSTRRGAAQVPAGGAIASISGVAHALDGVLPVEVVNPIDDGFVDSETFNNTAGCVVSDALDSRVADWSVTHLGDKTGCRRKRYGNGHQEGNGNHHRDGAGRIKGNGYGADYRDAAGDRDQLYAGGYPRGCGPDGAGEDPGAACGSQRQDGDLVHLRQFHCHGAQRSDYRREGRRLYRNLYQQFQSGRFGFRNRNRQPAGDEDRECKRFFGTDAEDRGKRPTEMERTAG